MTNDTTPRMNIECILTFEKAQRRYRTARDSKFLESSTIIGMKER